MARVDFSALVAGFCRLDTAGSRLSVDTLSRLQVLGFTQPVIALTWLDLCRVVPEQPFRLHVDALYQHRIDLLMIFLGVLEK